MSDEQGPGTLYEVRGVGTFLLVVTGSGPPDEVVAPLVGVAVVSTGALTASVGVVDRPQRRRRRLAGGLDAEGVTDVVGDGLGHPAVRGQFPANDATEVPDPLVGVVDDSEPPGDAAAVLAGLLGAYSGRTPHQVRTTGASATAGSIAAHSSMLYSASQSARSYSLGPDTGTLIVPTTASDSWGTTMSPSSGG